jgi:hypothetical protein
MKRKTIWYAITTSLILAAISIFSSCKTAYYPTTINSPMLSNKGEFQATGIIGTGNFELQTAYAVTDNIGIMLNGSYFSSQRELTIEDEIVEISEKHNLIEAGVGYVNHLGEMAKFEVFAGGGVGKVPADFRGASYVYDGSQTAQMSKFFIQPSVGIGSSFVDFSGGVRISGVSINNEFLLFAEPGLSVKLGYKNVRFVASMGLSLPFVEMEDRTWDNNMVIVGLGMQLNLGREYE